MAGNFVYSGQRLTLAAPYDVASGAGAIIGSHIFAVALGVIASGANGEWATAGVWDLLAVTADTFAVGALVYWDNTAKKCTSTSSSNTLIGVATKTKANGDTAVRVKLDGVHV